jgi:hypothetical protein
MERRSYGFSSNFASKQKLSKIKGSHESTLVLKKGKHLSKIGVGHESNLVLKKAKI